LNNKFCECDNEISFLIKAGCSWLSKCLFQGRPSAMELVRSIFACYDSSCIIKTALRAFIFTLVLFPFATVIRNSNVFSIQTFSFCLQLNISNSDKHKLQTSAVAGLRSSLFWDVARTAGPLKMRTVCCSESLISTQRRAISQKSEGYRQKIKIASLSLFCSKAHKMIKFKGQSL